MIESTTFAISKATAAPQSDQASRDAVRGVIVASTGIEPTSVTPAPGALRTWRRPPSAASRSAIPWSPEPRSAVVGIEPLAVVDDLEDEDPFDCASRTVAADASAYFATFCSASRQEK